MNNKKNFGSYEELQPYHEDFKQHGKLNDFTYQSLVHLGSASQQISWASTVIEEDINVPNEIKKEMIQVNQQIHAIQEKLRSLKIEK